MNVKKTRWSIIPRKCSCGCNRRYFSPMWKVYVGSSEVHTVDTVLYHKEYELFSVKEFPDSKDLPKRGIKLSTNMHSIGNTYLVPDYVMTDSDWDIIRQNITKSEFLTINYNIHVYPLSISDTPITGVSGLRYVALCVQEIPEIIVIGPDYTTASLRLKEKLERWYDNHQTSQIPRPQEYDPNFVLSKALKK